MYQYSTPHWRSQGPQHGSNRPFINRNYPIYNRGSYNENSNSHNGTDSKFWCETCDRGFPTKQSLEKHKNQHQKCNIDGCQFIAHPKVITKHIQMQHSSGLYQKISKLNNPEEILKWREERKRKYPTKTNIDKKASEIKEKIERGERMDLYEKRKFGNTKPNARIIRNTTMRKDNRRRKDNTICIKSDDHKANTKKPAIIKNIPKLSIPSSDDKCLKPFAGIQNLMMEFENDTNVEPASNYNIADDEWDNYNNSNVASCQKGNVCTALSALMCNYNSSDDESDDKIVKVTNASISNNQDTLKQDSDNDSGPEEVNNVKISTEENIKRTQCVESKTRNKEKLKPSLKNNTIQRKQKKKLPSTLLEKLLANEIKHERNMILQCIRHIVKNNFFENT